MKSNVIWRCEYTHSSRKAPISIKTQDNFTCFFVAATCLIWIKQILWLWRWTQVITTNFREFTNSDWEESIHSVQSSIFPCIIAPYILRPEFNTKKLAWKCNIGKAERVAYQLSYLQKMSGDCLFLVVEHVAKWHLCFEMGGSGLKKWVG